MANLTASRYGYPQYGSSTTTTASSTTTADFDDQVDNNTHATNSFSSILKPQGHFIRIMNDKYHREDERLRTFENWPLVWLDKTVLARTGMFYTNDQDKVKCYFCEVEIGRWEADDQPVPEHLRWSPNCPLLRRRTTNNVPISIEALDRILPPPSFDICGANDALEVREHTISEGRIPMDSMIRSMGTSTHSLATATEPALMALPPVTHSLMVNGSGHGSDVPPQVALPGTAVSRNYFPEYPEYAIESARLRSFADWPRNMKQKPQQLAEAGFFYTGTGDRVRCFSCGGGLKDWDDTDEPWEQHALWLCHCRFLKLMKGQLYIDTVVAEARAPAEQSSEEATTTPTNTPSPTSSEDSNKQNSQQATETQTQTQTQIQTQTVAATVTATIKASAQEQEEAVVSPVVAQQQPPVVIPEEKLCKICYAGEYNTAFLPCGHVVACAKCASSVTKCPLCRKPFTDVMRVYFS